VRIEGDALAAATQTLFAKTATPVIPASAAVSGDVDLIVPPDTVPDGSRSIRGAPAVRIGTFSPGGPLPEGVSVFRGERQTLSKRCSRSQELITR
jgi:hypothetical protein